jgi:hypothetical protein
MTDTQMNDRRGTLMLMLSAAFYFAILWMLIDTKPF